MRNLNETQTAKNFDKTNFVTEKRAKKPSKESVCLDIANFIVDNDGRSAWIIAMQL